MSGMARDPAERPGDGRRAGRRDRGRVRRRAGAGVAARVPRRPRGAGRPARAVGEERVTEQMPPPRRSPRQRWEPPPPKAARTGLNRAIAAPGMFGLLILVAIGIGITIWQKNQQGRREERHPGRHAVATTRDNLDLVDPHDRRRRRPSRHRRRMRPTSSSGRSTSSPRTTTSTGSWKLAGEGLRTQLGGFESFRNALSTLQKIEFTSLKIDSSSPVAAVVSFTTVATHPDRIDHCQGSASADERLGRLEDPAHLDHQLRRDEAGRGAAGTDARQGPRRRPADRARRRAEAEEGEEALECARRGPDPHAPGAGFP